MNVSFALDLSLLTVVSQSLSSCLEATPKPKVTNGQNSCTGSASESIKDQLK
jgi:hypothetical protein